MRGEAAQLLWNTENYSYADLVHKLKKRYSSKGVEGQYQIQLRCRRRKKGETIRELAHDVRRLLALAYPGKNSKIFEHLARDAFLSALDDPILELSIREKDPSTLEAAVKIAQHLELCKEVVDAKSAPQRQRMNRHIVEDAASVSKIEASSDDIENMITTATERAVERALEVNTPKAPTFGGPADTSQLATDGRQGRVPKQNRPLRQRDDRRNSEKFSCAASVATGKGTACTPVTGPYSSADMSELNELRDQVRSLTSEVQHLKGRDQPPAVAQGQPAYGSGYQNFYRSNIGSSSNPGQNYGARPPGVQRAYYNSFYSTRGCWNCGNPKHFAKACPLVQNFQQNGQEAVEGPPNTSTVAMVRSSAALRFAPDNCLPVRINGRECECVLDTGSDANIVPCELVDDCVIMPTSQQFWTASDTPISIVGLVTTTFSTGKYTTSITAYVSDCIIAPLMGSGWILANCTRWKFADSVVYIRDIPHQLVPRTWTASNFVGGSTQPPLFGGPADTQSLKAEVIAVPAEVLSGHTEEAGSPEDEVEPEVQRSCQQSQSSQRQNLKEVKPHVGSFEKSQCSVPSQCDVDSQPASGEVSSRRERRKTVLPRHLNDYVC